MSTLALDIGGANIKAAHSDGTALCLPFALWKQPATLGDCLRQHFGDPPDADDLLLTMTGELCDCFETRADGVACILDAVEDWAVDVAVKVWSITDNGFVALGKAKQQPMGVASANWHALATFVAEHHPDKSGLLIDIGSTTTDIAWLEQGQLKAIGRNDRDRLASGELVYTGIQRTPVAAVAQYVMWQGRTCHIAAEAFAFMSDVYTLLGLVPESASDVDTADGRPRTRPWCANRILRMLGSDSGMNSEAEAHALAVTLADSQRCQIVGSASRVMAQVRPSTNAAPFELFFLSGSGEFLAKRVAESLNTKAPIHRLADTVSPQASTAACAYALLQLHQRACHNG